MIKIDIDDSRVMAALARLSQAAVNASPVMKTIASIMWHEVEDNFAEEGRPKWMGLKPSSNKKRQGGKILQDTSRLVSSITPHSDATSAAVGTNVKYAAIHQFGGDIKRNAYSRKVRHRTDRDGNLLRTGKFGGKGLIFAKDSHKRVITRWFEVGAHTINIPARPFLGLSDSGCERIVQAVNDYLRNAIK